MALTPFTAKTLRSFTLPSDSGPVKTIFKLRYFDLVLRSHFQGRFVTGESDPMLFISLVRASLVAWENFADADGPVECVLEDAEIEGVGTRTLVSIQSMESLELDWIAQLATEAIRMNFPSGELEKN